MKILVRMVSKVINGVDARPGTSIMIEGEPYMVKKMDVSKTDFSKWKRIFQK